MIYAVCRPMREGKAKDLPRSGRYFADVFYGLMYNVGDVVAVDESGAAVAEYFGKLALARVSSDALTFGHTTETVSGVGTVALETVIYFHMDPSLMEKGA